MLIALFNNGKLSFAKIFNFIRNKTYYTLKWVPPRYFPTFVFIEPTDQCNVSCVGCRNTRDLMYHDQTGFMTEDLFSNIIPGIKKHCLLVALYWMGEPLLHNKTRNMIRILSDNGIGCMIATNGMALTPRNSLALVESGLDIIKISISGITQETYVQYHRGGNIRRVIANVNALLATIREKNASTLVIIDYLKLPHNAHEVEPARTFFSAMDLCFHVRDAQDSRDDKTVDDHIVSDLLTPTTGICEWAWTTVAINWQGKIYPCCYVGAVQKNLIIGNLLEHSLITAFHGNELKNIMELHINNQRERIPACKDCYYSDIGFQTD
ncbi:MAG: SPASM domain-containing protein [Magnetococcales bacterium]|nr:SPASM domain-containing protein [Magnetococcales bacterium]MBF0151068.1 SPASM domain-containing protein [Magnetococcales bacterium]